MKKLLAAALALALALSLAACGAKPMTAEELYTKALEQSQAMEKMDATMDMNMKMALPIEGQTQTIDMTAKVGMKGENVGKEGMRFAMPMSISMPSLGMNMDMNVYYADSYYLMDVMGQKVKCSLPLDAAMEQMANMDIQQLDYVKELSMTKDDKTGNYTLTYKMDLEKLTDLNGELGPILGASGLDASALENMEFRDYSGTLVVDKDGAILSQTAVMDFSMVQMGQSLDCAMDMTATYNPIPKDFAVEIPDASEYEEVDASMMGLDAGEASAT